MNKVTGFMGAALLAGGVLAGCSADSENTAPEEETVEETAVPEEQQEVTEIEETETGQADETAEDTAEDTADTASDSTDNAAEEVDGAAEQAESSLQEEAADMGEAVEEGASEIKESVENAGEESSEGTEATGTFNGLADPHTVEIEVDGTPAAYQVEAGSDTMAKFETMEPGESVTFVYVENGEQLVINEVK